MIFFEEALKIVLGQAITLKSERVSLSESCGRILAEDIFSDMDMPPFDKSAVDGYACRMADLQIPDVGSQNDLVGTQYFVSLQVVETIPAGKIPEIGIGQGECSKIMTGAMIPEGADCVVMVEDSEMTAENIVVFKRDQSAKNICYTAENIKNGELVLKKGVEIGPAHMAVLAGVGTINPLVASLPRIAIISTGDELVEPDVIPGKAQIRNSNASQLEAQVRKVPAIPVYTGIVADEGSALRSIIDRSMIGNDVVLLTGGVSMGDYDFVPEIMVKAGIEILFKSIAIQPGRPTVFGRKGDRFIFGLPGNPVSSYIMFEMLVKPFLLNLMGHTYEPLKLFLPMAVNYSRGKSARKSLIPVQIRNGAVYPVEYHGSAHINAYTDANGILIMEIGTTNINQGELVHVRPI